MRKHGPDGEPHGPDAYVFGTGTGERVKTPKRAWERAVLVAHGYKAEYVKAKVKTGALTPESRARLRTINLHFHDLRREASARWSTWGRPCKTSGAG